MLSFDVNFLTSGRTGTCSPPQTGEEMLAGFITSTVPSPPLLPSSSSSASEDSRGSLDDLTDPSFSVGSIATTSLNSVNSGGEEVDSPPRGTAAGKADKGNAKKQGVAEKPGHSYIALISMAILSIPEKKLVLGDIYRFIQQKYDYYQVCETSAWKNSIRHNLSLNECFIKNGRADNGKGHYWSVHPACEADFRRGDFRRRQARRRAKRCHQQQPTAVTHQLPSPYSYPVTGGYVPMTQMPTGMGGGAYRRGGAAPYHPYLPAGGHSTYLSMPSHTSHAQPPLVSTAGTYGTQYSSQYSYAVPKSYPHSASSMAPPNVNACQMADFPGLGVPRSSGSAPATIGTQPGQAALAALNMNTQSGQAALAALNMNSQHGQALAPLSMNSQHGQALAPLSMNSQPTQALAPLSLSSQAGQPLPHLTTDFSNIPGFSAYNYGMLSGFN